MTCDECNKNKATVHLTEIINNQITKLNLCEGCAKQKGTDVEQHFGIADLLAALSDVESTHSSKDTTASKVRCTTCGMTYDDFKKVGRLGCSDCYAAFKASLSPLLKKIHGSVQHVGKSPDPEALKDQHLSTRLQDDLAAAKAELTKAVKKEEFEEAATLRDKIKFLEKKIKELK